MVKRSSGTQIWLFVVVVLIGAGVAAYFVGRAMERNASEQAANAGQQQYAAVKSQLQGAQGQIASLQSANQLLTANVWAYRASVALDNRNFGVANAAVAKVVTSLSTVDATSAGLDSKSLAALQKEAAGVKISVATNLESQRTQLLHLAASITALVGQADTKATAAH